MCSGNGYEAGDMHILTTYITSINHMHILTPDFMSPLTWHFLPLKVLESKGRSNDLVRVNVKE